MPIPDPTIEPATKADLPAILGMAQALAAHHDDTAAVTLATLTRDILGTPAWAPTLVARAESRPIGYATLCPLIQLQWGVRGMEVHHLFVLQDWRGRGIGQRLIKAAMKTAADIGCVYMTVGTHPDNHPAQRLYQAAGFTPLPDRGPRFSIRLKGQESPTQGS
ncbi:N-acetyltransferase family protein [Profundibacter sp.]|uniref:GNAT family N-acetyltransferase n=1 Tax=Profundibacter sp. TaxID=3101071 RepID=UPI003D095AAA